MTLLRAMDDIDEPPDPTRPTNPWPRLLLFGSFVLVSVVIVGACIAAFTSSVPERELRVELSEIDVAMPRFEPIVPFGNDSEGRTFGIWVGFDEDGELTALLSREPSTGCHLRYLGTETVGDSTGVLADPCGPARYSRGGVALHVDAPRDLPWFELEIDGGEIVIGLDEVVLGACRAVALGCSPVGGREVREVPEGVLTGQFGAR